jgi:manganese/zinc/iron transport system permease protein
MNTNLLIAVVAVLTTSACALAGVFLVLRRMAMMADAISHAVLPGLVAGFVLAHMTKWERGGELLASFAGAVAAGLLTVVLVETLTKSRRVKEDAAIGVVFPALFALGVFVISKYLANVHIDTDAVLFGEIAFTPFDTLVIGDRDYGPQAIWTLGGLTLLNGGFLALFYKELKLSTFDPGLAAALGFAPVMIHYTLMSMVAVTTVGAFNAVGAILAVALIIVPPVTASLLTRRLPILILLSLVVGAVGALLGLWLALRWNVSISGMIATMLGILFGITLLLAPEQGLVAQAVRRHGQRRRFAAETLLVHLATHEGTDSEGAESERIHLHGELLWKPGYANGAITMALNAGWITEESGNLRLTEEGRDRATEVANR